MYYIKKVAGFQTYLIKIALRRFIYRRIDKFILNTIIFMSYVLTFSTYVVGQALTGIDDLGRVLPLYSEVGKVKKNKQVGLFYFLWQGDTGSPTSEYHWDLSKIYQDYPEVFHDFYASNWGGGAKGAGRYYFWGEPIYGYYRGDDYWVHLKNMQLLSDAKVDFIVLDATNRLTYTNQVYSLLKAMKHIRAQGKQSPKLVFYTNTASGDAMQEIYQTFYAPQVCQEIKDNWYYLDGKPLIIGISKEAKDRDYEHFFTIRESQWPNEAEKIDGWPWIEFQRPQKVYKNHRGEREIVNVSAAQHPNLDASMGGAAFYGMSGNWGRSYHANNPGNPEQDVRYGYNIQEQWDFALRQDVPFIFITGWNEWIAGKWNRTDDKKNQAHFVDQANAEYSRDIEPTWTAGLKDSYYMQMISNIRRYKGMEEVPILEKVRDLPKLDKWQNIAPIYVDFIGDVIHRNHPGAQSEPKTMYINESGRNDFKELKLLTTADELGFYAQTVSELSPVNGDSWMTLWLNTDENYNSGWHGYDYRVIHGERLQRFLAYSWQDIGKVSFEQHENKLLIRIPYIKIAMFAKGVNLEFKWSDNMMKDDPLDWYINGDTAPGGRLNLSVKIDAIH